MCYLIARDIYGKGCIAWRTEHGMELAKFKKRLLSHIGYDEIELITISRPLAYAEYEPYCFVDTKDEFERKVLGLKDEIR